MAPIRSLLIAEKGSHLAKTVFHTKPSLTKLSEKVFKHTEQTLIVSLWRTHLAIEVLCMHRTFSSYDRNRWNAFETIIDFFY